MSYIKVIGDTIQVFGEVKPDEDAIYVQSIPHIDIPKYQKLVYENDTVKVVTDIDGIKQAIYNKLLMQYKEAIKSTDDEFLAYQKRQQLNIVTNKDTTDYQAVLTTYNEATTLYHTERDRVADMDDEELIEYYNLIKGGLA
jgi:Tfp pilus assembly major pilin PilA